MEMETLVELLFMERRGWKLFGNLCSRWTDVLDANDTNRDIDAFERGAFQ